MAEKIVEEWRPIPRMFGAYDISNTGTVRSNSRVVKNGPNSTMLLRTRILRPSSNDGYLHVVLSKNGRTSTCHIHRMMGVVFFGVKRRQDIDHRDGNPSNNLLSNLRVCTTQQNLANSKLRKAGTETGLKGVKPNCTRTKFQARIKVDYKEIYIGTFASKEAAHAAYCAAAKQYFGEFARAA